MDGGMELPPKTGAVSGALAAGTWEFRGYENNVTAKMAAYVACYSHLENSCSLTEGTPLFAVLRSNTLLSNILMLFYYLYIFKMLVILELFLKVTK